MPQKVILEQLIFNAKTVTKIVTRICGLSVNVQMVVHRSVITQLVVVAVVGPVTKIVDWYQRAQTHKGPVLRLTMSIRDQATIVV
jgi:hypothetical protein